MSKKITLISYIFGTMLFLYGAIISINSWQTTIAILCKTPQTAVIQKISSKNIFAEINNNSNLLPIQIPNNLKLNLKIADEIQVVTYHSLFNLINKNQTNILMLAPPFLYIDGFNTFAFLACLFLLVLLTTSRHKKNKFHFMPIFIMIFISFISTSGLYLVSNPTSPWVTYRASKIPSETLSPAIALTPIKAEYQNSAFTIGKMSRINLLPGVVYHKGIFPQTTILIHVDPKFQWIGAIPNLNYKKEYIESSIFIIIALLICGFFVLKSYKITNELQ